MICKHGGIFEIRLQCVMCVYIYLSHVNAAQTDRLYFVLQPAQLLKGDIMVSDALHHYQLCPIIL